MNIEQAATDAAKQVLHRAKQEGKFRGATTEELDTIAEAVGAGLAATREELMRSGMDLLGRVIPRRRV